MRYNKSEIMKAAWAMYRSGSRDLHGRLVTPFSTCLRIAWANAKANATVEDLEQRLFFLNMKDRWTAEDQKEMRVLDAQISQMKKAA